MSATIIHLPLRKRQEFVEVERCIDPASGRPIFIFEFVTHDRRRIPLGTRQDRAEATDDADWFRGGRMQVVEAQQSAAAVADRYAGRLAAVFSGSHNAILRACGGTVRNDGVTAALAVLREIKRYARETEDRAIEAAAVIASIDLAVAVRAAAPADDPEGAAVAELLAARAAWDQMQRMTATALDGALS